LFSPIRQKELRTITFRAILVSLFATFLSFIISYFLFKKTSKRFQITFLALITIPLLINESVRVFSWQLLLSENGLFNSVLSKLSGTTVSFFNGSNFNNVIFVMLISIIPFGIFINTASLNITPKIYWKASRDLGLKSFSTFLKIALPISKISIAITFIISFFLAFSLSSEVNFLGGASKISIRNLVLSLMSSNNFSAIFLLGSVLTFFIFLLSVVIKIYVKKSKTRF
jgi:ABC-type spermidine/putrescine transport system permease subunit I